MDSALLVKFYAEESNSEEIIALAEKAGTPFCFSELHETELTNALYLKLARREISDHQLRQALREIQADRDAGILQNPQLVWPDVWSATEDLTKKYTQSTLCRTLDVMHVASALVLGFKSLATTDARQIALARKAGLKVLTI